MAGVRLYVNVAQYIFYDVYEDIVKGIDSYPQKQKAGSYRLLAC